MATRPAKRQRRSTKVLSDDDEVETKASSLPLQTPGFPRAHLNRGDKAKPWTKSPQKGLKNSVLPDEATSSKLSPSLSPRKTRTSRKQSLNGRSNKSLHSFFGKASEEERWQRSVDTTTSQTPDDDIVDEIVDDESFDEELIRLSDSKTVHQAPGLSSSLTGGAKTTGSRSSTPSFSQKFAKPSTLSSKPSRESIRPEIEAQSDSRPWAERYGPTSTEELAVHKKKIVDVQKWLEAALRGKSGQRILVLKGPAGSGKSTTISLLAQAMNLQTTSWRNPTVAEAGSVSSVHQFADFLDTGGQFEALSFDKAVISDQASTDTGGQILLVEEFPAVITKSLQTLNGFRSTLLQYLSRDASYVRAINQPALSMHVQPLVLVISETLLSSSTALSDSFTAHRLLGVEILNHPMVYTIEFNPVAPTFMSKALDTVIKKEARDSKRQRIPGPAVLQKLADVGDIRSAINSLEFLCARRGDHVEWSGTVAARVKRTPKDGGRLTEAEQNTLKVISQRETALDLFHATGKVVYNKREDPRVSDSRAEPPPKPPDHLMHLYTPKVSQVNVEALLSEVGTDIQTFISTLHENYVLSCNGADFVDSQDACAQALSDADVLNPESHGIVRGKASSQRNLSHLQFGNSDMLRQDEISFHVVSRGLLFSLPFPINRAVPYGARKQDAFKMFYPASLRLWKPAEEINDLISLYVNGIGSGVHPSSRFSGPTHGVASWKSRGSAFSAVLPSEDLNGGDGSQSPSRSLASRDSLVADVLPYMAMIRATRKQDTQVLEKITQFRGVDILGEELQDQDFDPSMTALPRVASTLGQRVEEAHRVITAQKAQQNSGGTTLISTRHQKQSANLTAAAAAAAAVAAEEKLYISDDDIQDE